MAGCYVLIAGLAMLAAVQASTQYNFELYITPWFPLAMCIPGTEQVINNGVLQPPQQS